jgi:hypothetical protein
MGNKKPETLSPDDVKKMISFEVAGNAAEVAEGVFKKMYEEREGKMEGKISKFMYGAIAAGVFLFLTMIGSTLIFMGSYQTHYLDTQTSFDEKMSTMLKGNQDFRLEIKTDIERIKDKQDYTDRLLLEKR